MYQSIDNITQNRNKLKSILNKKISVFRRVAEPQNPTEVNLLEVLTSDKYKPLVEQCSQITDKKERNKWKVKNVPAITVSGTFSYRSEKNLIKHSGLIALDLDGVSDIDELKNEVIQLPFVAYCGKSVSQTGLFAIIHIPESTIQEHKERFNALEKLFISNFGISEAFDTSVKDISRCRFVSFDADAYFNHDADVYTGILKESIREQEASVKPQQKQYHRPTYFNNNTLEKVWECVDIIQDRKLDFAPDYDTYIKTGFALASLGEDGREIFHAVCQYSTKYNYKDADVDFTNCLKKGREITLGTFFYYCNDYGINESKQNEYIPKNWKIYQPPKEILQKIKERNEQPHHEPITPPQIAVVEPKGGTQAIHPPKEKEPLNVIEIDYSDLPFFDDAPTPIIKNEFDYTKEIEEVKQFFENTELPKEPIKLDVCTTVMDCKKAYLSHIPIIENYNGKPIAKPYLDRLLNLKKWIKSNNQNKWLSLDELKAIFKPYSNYYPDEVLEHINREQLKELKKDNFFSFDKNVGVYFLSNSTPF